ncbi:MAG: hypothetical protein JWO31_2915 [Phycisphaerales bacterium]|nr:hypothetical protein [Phycisphaerales bacterium]
MSQQQQWNISPAAGEGDASIRLSEVVGALSAALDITEGQPEGHAARSCMIGMRLADAIALPADVRSDLFYALLLKDLGCSSNAAKMCQLLGADDRTAKRDVKLVDWTSVVRSVGYLARTVLPGGPLGQRVAAFAQAARDMPAAAHDMVQTRCDRGALIARQLMLSESTAEGIRSLDELWDGSGNPDRLKGDAIPLLSRIMNLAQTAEVFLAARGVDAMFAVVKRRSGSWFDPELAKAFRSTRKDAGLWAGLTVGTASGPLGPVVGGTSMAAVAAYEPADRVMVADPAALDRIAAGFAMVVDAKSPWTFKHSDGVAEISEGIARQLGCMPGHVQYIRRAALLHDVGKLGVSNLILDKPAKLDPAELATMRRHPGYTHRILSRVRGFSALADVAAAHHERIDGKGYHRGAAGDAIPLPARILAVADMYEALAAHRPYRQDLTAEDVMTILKRNVGGGLCPEVFEALCGWLSASKYQAVKLDPAAAAPMKFAA